MRAFLKDVEHVLRVLKRVYINDAYTKESNMSPDERLEYHRDIERVFNGGS